MDMQEWQAYVKKVANSQYPVPEGMIKNYDDWRCRSIVGRMLYVLEDIEGAIAVLLTVKDIKPNLQDVPEKGLSEAEHMVLCLRDIAEIIYKVMGNVPIAITYLGHAHQICRAYKHPFRSADKGGVWHRSLELMEEIGETEKAIAKAEAMLEEEKDILARTLTATTLIFIWQSKLLKQKTTLKAQSLLLKLTNIIRSTMLVLKIWRKLQLLKMLRRATKNMLTALPSNTTFGKNARLQ